MNKQIVKAIYGSPDRPVKIAGREIAAYVLNDKKHTRVLVQRGMQEALGVGQGGGRAQKGGGGEGRAQTGDRLLQLVEGQRINPFVSKEVLMRAQNPIKFKLPNGVVAYGYEATLLPEICNAVLEAREERKLIEKQLPLAKRCEILVRGFAATGIIALVDEATGYQEVRDREALQKILDKYITDKWAQWTKTFPDEFYKQLFRLKSMTYPPIGKKPHQRPGYIGHWTNDIVYKRLAPGVLNKLKEVEPRLPSGKRRRTFHQHMTPDYGTPELRRYLENIIFLMKGCTTWMDFKRKLNRAAPEYSDQMPLDLGYRAAEEDEGDE